MSEKKEQEVKESTIKTAQEMKVEFKAYQRRVEDVQEAIKKWKDRGFFDKVGAYLTSESNVVSEFKEARQQAREAVRLGARILRAAKTIKADSAVDRKSKGDVSKIEGDVTKSMQGMEKMSRSSDIALFFKQNWPVAVALITLRVAAAALAVVGYIATRRR